jgi:hypothetical protein
MKTNEQVTACIARGYPETDAEAWYRKFVVQRSHAQQRGIGRDLTFEQYLSLAKESGLENPAMIGKSDGCYHLARIEDAGDYTLSNCRFIPAEHNRLEAVENGRYAEGQQWRVGQTKETSETIRRMAETKTGRTKVSHQGIATQADKLAKEFVLKAPDGTVHRGKNVVEFCREHGLQHSNLYGVFSGKKNHHKGWTGHYVSSSQESCDQENLNPI